MQQTDAPRRLVLLRHAEAQQSAGTDLDRALTERGRADATAAGYWLGGLGITAGGALVSAATRAWETWESVSRAAGWTVATTGDRAVYTGEPETVLDLIRAQDADVDVLVVVGHNPTVESMAQLLDDGDGDQEAALAMLSGFAAGSVAVLAVAGPWADLGWGDAQLVAFRPGSR